MSFSNQDILTGDVSAPLPTGLVTSQRCAAVLRAYLEDANLAHYRIFFVSDNEMWDTEKYLAELGENAAAWEAAPPLVPGGHPLDHMTFPDDSFRLWHAGILRLPEHQVVLAKWYWIRDDDDGSRDMVWFAAAASPAAFHELRKKVIGLRRSRAARKWQVIRGFACYDLPSTRRVPPADLFISDAVRERVERELIGFFAPAVAELFASLSVPYRRGVLLHGPPGNGKTSLIRHLGASVPEVAAITLRRGGRLDIEETVRRWTAQAPAILVIEDLNWLFEQVNVSMFLNLLDGVDSKAGKGGLLLVATSNYPERLDPAINNRPGRFDVVIELPPPGRAMRSAYLRSKLRDADADLVERIAGETDGLSFAHLQEIVRLSGLMAIHDGRGERTPADLRSATKTVCDTSDEARRGFPRTPEVPFGLLPLRNRRKQEA